MEDVWKCDFEVKEFDEVMDFMKEDDDLISPSADSFVDSGNQMNELSFDFTESMAGLTLADSIENVMSREQVHQPFDSEVEANNRNRKCNLRKSLAWDSAFFSSAGVLDPEELSSMIGVAEIGRRKVLPRIQEDDMRSSVSTLDSDSLTLESLEAELFQDIRASIQKSNKVVSDIPLPPNNISISQGESHISIPSLPNTDHSSETKAKLAAKNTTKKLNVSATESLSKRYKSHTELTKDNHDEKCKETPSFRSKLQNGPGKPSNIPFSLAKQVSVSANHITNTKNVPKRLIGAARGAPLAKLHATSKPALPRPSAGGKISVSVSSKGIKKEHTVIRSSAESSSSVPSSSSAKFTVDSLNKNSASKAIKPPASTSIARLPSRIKSKDCNPPASKTKVQPSLSRLSASVKSSTTDISNSICPASSTSDWSNESTSSTSTVHQRSNNQGACAEASTLSISGEGEGDYPLAFDSLEQSWGSQPQIESDAITVSSVSSKVMNGSKAHSSLHHPVAAKPSGLRMPSPKIGFFDGVKSLARTPERSMQNIRGMPSGVAKGEGICSPSGASSNARIGKFQTHTTTGSLKMDDAQPTPTASVLKHVPHRPGRKLSSSLMKKHSAPEAADSGASLSSKLEKNVSPKTGGNSHDRFGRQKNDTRTGVVSTGEVKTTRFLSSLAEDSAQSTVKVSSRIDLPEIENLVTEKEATSETKIRRKGSIEDNCEGLDLKSAPVIIGRTSNDGETATDGDQMPELNSSVNSDYGSENVPITHSDVPENS